MAVTDPGLAPLPLLERADRVDEQPRETDQTGRVRVPILHHLQDPSPALRRPTELGATRPDHPMTTPKREAPTYLARKTAEGKTTREARRAHKRHLANRIVRRMWKDEQLRRDGLQPAG